MPSINAGNQLPYPLPTEPTRDGAANMKSIVDGISKRGYGECSGSSVTAIPSAAWTFAIGMTAVIADGAGLHIDTSGIVIDTPGRWEIAVTVGWQNGGAGRRGIGWTPSTSAGEAPVFGAQIVTSLGGGPNNAITQKFTDTYDITVSQRIVVRVYQDTGATVNVQSRRVTARLVW